MSTTDAIFAPSDVFTYARLAILALDYSLPMLGKQIDHRAEMMCPETSNVSLPLSSLHTLARSLARQYKKNGGPRLSYSIE